MSATVNTFPWTDSFLEPMRQAGGPLADGVVAELFAKSEVTAVNELMRSLIANEFPEPASLPPIVRDYLDKTDQLPGWANPDLIAAGERLFWRYGPKLILIFHCYSLPFDYLGRNGVQVLALTTRLVSNPTRRIVEVSQFLVDIMQKGGLTAPGGRGRRTIQKVRLMHAAVRKLAAAAPTWKPEFGLPVNQEDLAGTLMSFSSIVIDGLNKLGVTLSDADREAYLHCWLVAGHLLGIEQQLLPPNVESARALAAAVARRQFGPTAEGQELTRALVGMMANTLPGDVFRNVTPFLIRFFLGKEWASWLGVEEAHYLPFLSVPLRFLGIETSRLLEDSAVLNRLAEHVGHLLLESIVFVERGGNRPSFAIPADLRQQWGINWVS
ncbi:MAG: oxygenase MpaB family protein [Bryobacteraceae bacterium]